MQISSRFSLAIHILLFINYFKDTDRVTSDSLASSTNVNPVIIRKILLQLRDSGLVRAKRGTGGIELLQEPGEITLFDIYRAVEVVPDGRLFRIHEHPNPLCPVGRNISMLLEPRFASIQKTLEDELKNQTLEEFIREMTVREEDYTVYDEDKEETAKMSREERMVYLIGELQKEIPEYRRHRIPTDETGQWELLRSLFNLRPPYEAGREFLNIQDALLRDITLEKGIVDVDELKPINTEDNIALWKGDITRLRCDAIVNAANSQLLGCWQPLHSCIDNIIHTMSGVQLRIKCNEIMEKQGHEEPAGMAKITPAYNLPCRYVIHTVGPVVTEKLTKGAEQTLSSCYRSCLEIAEQNGLSTIAFCCISTGIFGFPAERAAEIAIDTVKNEMRENPDKNRKIVFDVYSDRDYKIYYDLLK